MQAFKDEPGQKPRLLNEQEKSAAKTKLENTSPIKANAGVIWSRPATTDHYFVYPIEYNGNIDYVFCCARQDNMTNRLYVHEVFLADNIYKKSNALQTGDSASSVNTTGGIAFYRNILTDVLNANVQQKSDNPRLSASLLLFVVSDFDGDTVVFQRRSNGTGFVGTQVSAAIVVGKQHLGTDGPGRLQKLFGRHSVGLVARQKGDVNVAKALHFRYRLGIAGNVNPQSVERQQIPVVTPLRMKLQVVLGGVVGGNRFDQDVIGQLQSVAIGHGGAGAVKFDAAWIHDQAGLFFGKGVNGGSIVVVVVFVGNEDVVGLGQTAVVHRAFAQLRARVDLKLEAVVFNADAGMHQGVHPNGFAARSLKFVELVGWHIGRFVAGCQSQRHNQVQESFHGIWELFR